MAITDQIYLDWQKKLQSKNIYKRVVVFFGIYSLLVLAVIFILAVFLGKFYIIPLSLVSLFLARLIISPLVFLFYKKKRPYQNLNFETTYSWLFSLATKKENSFPSDHAISYAAIAGVYLLAWPFVGILITLLGLANGVARVILGYHYPVDILAGWLFGFFAATLTFYWIYPILFTH